MHNFHVLEIRTDVLYRKLAWLCVIYLIEFTSPSEDIHGSVCLEKAQSSRAEQLRRLRERCSDAQLWIQTAGYYVGFFFHMIQSLCYLLEKFKEGKKNPVVLIWKKNKRVGTDVISIKNYVKLISLLLKIFHMNLIMCTEIWLLIVNSREKCVYMKKSSRHR